MYYSVESKRYKLKAKLLLNLSKFLFLNRSKGKKWQIILEIILTKPTNYIYTCVSTRYYVHAHPRYYRVYRRFTFGQRNNTSQMNEEAVDLGRSNRKRFLEDRNDFFLRCIKRNIPFFSSSIVAAAFISWFRYFMEAFDTVRCFGSRVYRGRLEMRSRES